MNRDLAKLRGVRYAMAAMKSIENSLQWQRDKLLSCTTRGGDGMPHGGGAPSGMEQGFASLSALEAERVACLQEYAERALEAERILKGIKNDRVRLFVRLFYVDDEHVDDIRRACKWSLRKLKYVQSDIINAASMEKVNEIYT